MIHRNKQKWGMLLTVSPFSGGKFADMKIQADIVRPAAGRGQVAVRFEFSRLPIAEKFSRVEMTTWLEAIRAILEESTKEASRFKSTAGGFERARKAQKARKRATAVK